MRSAERRSRDGGGECQVSTSVAKKWRTDPQVEAFSRSGQVRVPRGARSPTRHVFLTVAYSNRVSRRSCTLYFAVVPARSPTSYQRGTESFFASPQGDTLPISPGGQPVRPAETRSKRSPTKNASTLTRLMQRTRTMTRLSVSSWVLYPDTAPSFTTRATSIRWSIPPSTSERFIISPRRSRAAARQGDDRFNGSTSCIEAANHVCAFSVIRPLIRYVSYANAAAAAPCDRTVSVPDTAQCSTVP